MLSVEEARIRIMAKAHPLGGEICALPQALGRVASRAIKARLTQPPQDVSSMDGYALALDGFSNTRHYKTVAEIPAGRPWSGKLEQGDCARIFTGGFIPAGADCVILQENAIVRPDQSVRFDDEPKLGQWIRTAGLDFQEGQTLIEAGTILTARHLGVLASANRPFVEVTRYPRVAILATGDELALPGDRLQYGQIINSNSFALAAALELAGALVQILPHTPDDESAISDAASLIGGSDVVLGTGGASVGKHDLMQQSLLKRGLVPDFWKVAIRPGKPLIFGTLDNIPFFGLPGNPVSVMVCYLIFVWPFIMRLLGVNGEEADIHTQARLDEPLAANDSRESYLRARIIGWSEGLPLVTAFSRQDSSMQATLAEADCLIRCAPFAPALPRHSLVEIIAFPASLKRF